MGEKRLRTPDLITDVVVNQAGHAFRTSHVGLTISTNCVRLKAK